MEKAIAKSKKRKFKNLTALYDCTAGNRLLTDQ